ncbi:hypothetical protein FLM44_25585 (plasmid) [Pseudoalteromonas luteoviolacea]|nr:hypothetical protein FLM44_25585 [Pseudoalteromonas luteoviolacea]
MEDGSTHPENEIQCIAKQFQENEINEDEMLTLLSSLSVMRYRFTIKGRIWKPAEESFYSFTAGTYLCFCAECPLPIHENWELKNFVRELYVSFGKAKLIH